MLAKFLPRAAPKTSRKLWWALTVALYPPASLIATTAGCAGSLCKLSCGESNVCLAGGCFPDDKSQCVDYIDSPYWTSTWEKGSAIHCVRNFDANGTPTSVSCIGIIGEAKDIACTCNFVYSNGVAHCG